MDITGGDNFVFMGTSQLLSVPFSLFSDNGVPDGQNPGDMLYWSGTQWLKVNAGLNGQVLTFNDGMPVWGGVQLPILNTNPVNNITAFTAYCGGNIASDGGSPVTVRGLCWNSAPNPTTANFKTTNGSGAGSFNANLNALSASTLYYVRAYATNSAGTSYGNEVSFTTANGSITLTTTAITAITVNSATSGGNITNNGGASVTMRGVCWNTSPFPTTANSKTTNGPGNGVFVSELTGLAANTLYYVRAYATNSLGTSYGNQQSFTTLSGIITLTTAEVTEITTTTAISGGEITNDGGSPVTARGVCWSTSQNPTIADSTTIDGSGNGVFVSNLAGLLPDTLYYVRSYATNGVGTFYGNEISFTTLLSFLSCGDVVNYHGQNYNTVLIGTQCWFKENLNVGTMIPGASEQTDNGTIEKYCYDNNPENCNVYGGLYQWDEMMQYTIVPGVQGICPANWHLPTDAEWTTLTTYLGGEGIAGGKMKETGTAHWSPPNTGATNSSGFTGLPGGVWGGVFGSAGSEGYWWTSTDWSSVAWNRSIYFGGGEVYRNLLNQVFGFSIRCLNDEITTSQLNITPTNQEVTAPAGTTTFEVSSNTSWTIEESVSWLTVSPLSGGGNGTLTITYEANSSAESRIGQITITSAGGNPVVNVTVTQEGAIPWSCGQAFTDERDGKTYNTVQIGNQCWMAENINIGTRIAGVTEQTNNTTIEKYCYDNSEANCDNYGGLYQWNEMINYSTTAGLQGICMTGWHLPTDAEWCTITTYLDATVNCSTMGWSGTNAGGKMKETGTSHWTSPNTGATNSSGFTALPGGYRSTNLSFYGLGLGCNLWSSTQYNENNSWYHGILNSKQDVDRGYYEKVRGYSVRCLKDETTTSQLNITPANQDVAATAGTTTFEVTSNTSWTVEESISWFSVSPMTGSNDGTLTVFYEANTSSESRIGQITITAEGGNPVVNVTVTQAGAPQWECGQAFTDGRDGKNYNTVLIGTQCWMKENLAWLPSVSPPSSGSLTTPFNYVYGYYGINVTEAKATSNFQIYGTLYNWPAAINACPSGWHLPSDDEWCVVTSFLDSNVDCSSFGWTGTDTGGKMKESGTLHWTSPNIGATNSSSFTALPAGISDFYSGSFRSQSDGAYFWTSTENNNSVSWFWYLNYNESKVGRSGYGFRTGISIRCLKDN
jgi:uncharacterized protein (TIGR02145 family)